MPQLDEEPGVAAPHLAPPDLDPSFYSSRSTSDVAVAGPGCYVTAHFAV